MRFLEFPNMASKLQTINRAFDNPCEWLPTVTTFNEWMESSSKDEQHPCLLQIVDKPGSGKSTLMIHLVDSTRSFCSGGDTVVIDFFFNSRGEQLEHCMRGLLRALLYQLINSHPACLGARFGSGQYMWATLASHDNDYTP